MKAKRSSVMGWLFIGPAFLHLLIFALIPVLYAFVLSLYKWQPLKNHQPFVGLQNYSLTFAEPSFWNAMWNSFRYALFSVPLGMFVALMVAILVNQKLRGVTIFRTLFYLPAISSGVAIAMIWIYIYLPETGMINTVLTWLGINNKTDFLNNVGLAMWALIFMSIWTGVGPKMVLFLAGLIGIPPSLYEAAELDGAGKFRSFWSVTLPMLMPTTLFVMVTSTIGAMQIFTPVYMMTKGGPDQSTDVVGYHVYTEAFVNFNFGIASAQSFVLLVVILIISIFQFKLTQSRLQGYSVA